MRGRIGWLARPNTVAERMRWQTAMRKDGACDGSASIHHSAEVLRSTSGRSPCDRRGDYVQSSLELGKVLPLLQRVGAVVGVVARWWQQAAQFLAGALSLVVQRHLQRHL